MTLFDRVFGGNDYNYQRTVAAIDAAIATYGESEAVAFPDTASLLTKVCLVKAMVFPVFMYGCES